MPILTINTNIKADQVPAKFKSLATDFVARELNKPVPYIAVHIKTGQDMSFGGTDEPTAICELASIGALSVELNKKHSKAFGQFLNQQLKIPQTRIYITFKDTPKGDIGYNGTTFDDLM